MRELWFGALTRALAEGAVVGRLLLTVALSAISCATVPATTHGCDGRANDHVMLVDRLRCNKLQVDIAGRAESSVLRGFGTLLVLSGGGLGSDARVASFNYDDTDLGADGRVIAEADAKKFAADGTAADRSATVAYQGTPHLYRRERVLAIYAGDDPAVTSLLTRLLGAQFAGR